MNARLLSTGGRAARLRAPIFAPAIGAVVVLALLWLAALTHPAGDSGSLDARVAAVGATVRCPVCQEGIPLNDIANVQADQMREDIRAQLQRGLSEDAVRQYLVDRYGASILLAPPQRGFDALAWFVPLLVVAACAVALLYSLRRWSGSAPAPRTVAGLGSSMPAREGAWQGTDVPGPEGLGASGAVGGEARRYEELLDRELQRRG